MCLGRLMIRYEYPLFTNCPKQTANRVKGGCSFLGDRMKLIPVTRGKFAQVDDEDFDRINQWRWQLSSEGYVFRRIWKRIDDPRKTSSMHREVLRTPVGFNTDHIDHDKLNNCKSNLRTCSEHENQGNSFLRKNNTSGFKGVCFDKNRKTWFAQIRNTSTRIRMGGFSSPEEAARAYDKKALEVFGKFARLNFSLPLPPAEGGEGSVIKPSPADLGIEGI
jgi:hypothetical protein